MFSDRPAIYQKVHHFLLIALGATLPLFFQLSNYITILLVLNWLLAGNYRYIKSSFSSHKLFTPTTLLFFAFVFGLIHTSNLAEGLKDIEHKIFLLLIPLIVFTSGKISKARLKKIFTAFVSTTLLAATVALAISTYKYANGSDATTFFYHQLANNVRMHAVYLACYLAFSFFILLHGAVTRKHTKLQWLILLLIKAYIVVLLILLSSKTILAAFVIALIAYAFLNFRLNKKPWYEFAAAGIICTAIVVAIATTPSYTSNRFKQVFDTKFEVLNQQRFKYDTEFSGLSLRLLFWKFAYLINDRENAHIFGVGTGDSKEKLNEIYREYNLYLGNTYIKGDTGYLNYNTHSQFVETYLKIGLAGLFFFTFYIFYLLYFAIKNKAILFTVWIILFIAFNVTETTLEVNKGITYFALFNSIFLAYLLAPVSIRNITSDQKPS